jgi:hypothetical protein
LKVTDPLGVPPAPVTVAVKVTASPTLLGFFEDLSVVAEFDTPTDCVSVGDVLAAKFASPL